MRTLVTAGLLAAGMIGFNGAANAQQPLGEEYCVYEKLTSTLDYEFVAEAYLYGDHSDADMQAVLKKAADACTTEHGMSADQSSVASEIGIYGAIADYLAEDLLLEGVSQDAVDSLFAVIDEMSDDDLDLLFEDDWRSDTAMVGRLKAAVIAQGIPDDAYSVDTALEIVELSAFAMDAVMAYMIADGPDGAS
ncbi:MAG: hypothetical protein Q8R82_12975 [Hyphomonadaceae bacterium]|nr:hypothetical protein [Hyphomonadaceae bacterium]